MRDIPNTTLTAIPGILVGHATDTAVHTGCTAVLCPEGFVPGVYVPGFAPASRETDLMRPDAAWKGRCCMMPWPPDWMFPN